LDIGSELDLRQFGMATISAAFGSKVVGEFPDLMAATGT